MEYGLALPLSCCTTCQPLNDIDRRHANDVEQLRVTAMNGGASTNV
jgi:hypothetical protein